MEAHPAHANYDPAPPLASAMIESLRAFGYDLPTAVADLIDNSVSAGADNVEIRFDWNGTQSRISVCDNGSGMTDAELLQAMRPGSRSPLEERLPSDLGRFGLGLKTASFSQCRCLTVISLKNGGEVAVRRWDLDYVESCCEWRLLRGHELAEDDWVAKLKECGSGTVVVWERMDRVVSDCSPDDEQMHRHFLEAASLVKEHLAMVFQYFLTGPGAVKISINNSQIEAWDPFLSREPTTEELAMERLQHNDAAVIVRPYVLPHHSKLSSEMHARGAGPRGWNAQQGFYVYRNNRLLVPGDWLGLGYKNEEHYKLARIRIDMPNSMDSAWGLDVKKSKATPPAPLRKDLRRIAKVVRERAARIYRHRGKVIQRQHSADYVFPWRKKIRSGRISYCVNRDHPLVKKVLDGAGTSRQAISSMLSLLEQTVPVPLIVMTNAEQPDSHADPYEGVKSEQVRTVMSDVYDALRQQGLNHDQAIQRISAMEPFNGFPELVAVLSEAAD